MSTYDVTVTHEDGLWVADVHGDDLGPAAMDYRRLAELRADLPTFIAGIAGVDPVEVRLRFSYDVGLMDKMLREYQDARRELEDARARYEQAQRAAVSGLRAEDVSLRDSAELLDVSFQRVQQLVHS